MVTSWNWDIVTAEELEWNASSEYDHDIITPSTRCGSLLVWAVLSCISPSRDISSASCLDPPNSQSILSSPFHPPPGPFGEVPVPREDRRGLLCVFSHRLQLIRLVTAGYRWDMLYCTVLYCTVLYWLSVRYALNTTQYFYSIQVQWWRWQIMCRIHLVVVQCQRDMMVLLSDVTRCLSPGHQGVKVWCGQVAVGSRSSALP